jgi:hypothetical protein
MAHSYIRRSGAGALGVALLLIVAACGGSASPSASTPASTAPSAAAPSVASVAPSTAPSTAPTSAPSAAGSATTGGVDPAKDVKIAAPYALVPLPAAAQQILEQQMTTSLGASSGKVGFGFRQISGGTGAANVLLVMQFESGTLNDVGYGAVLGGMAASMQADLTKSTVNGVEISSGKVPSGSIAIYHSGDKLFVAIASASEDALPIATALVNAN